MTTDIRREGTASCRLRVPDGYWQSRDQPCRFPPIATDGVYLEVALTEAHCLEVFVDGPLGRAWTLTSAAITHDPPILRLAVTWDSTAISLYLDGKRVAVAAV